MTVFGVLRSSRMNVAVVERGYYQLGALARLERSLLQFVLERARARGFRLVAVPDVLPAHYLVRAILLSLPLPLLYFRHCARRRAPACRCSTRRAVSSTDSPAPLATTQAHETMRSSRPPHLHLHRPRLPCPTGTCSACRAPRRWRSPLSAPTVSFASRTSRSSIPFPHTRTYSTLLSVLHSRHVHSYLMCVADSARSAAASGRRWPLRRTACTACTSSPNSSYSASPPPNAPAPSPSRSAFTRISSSSRCRSSARSASTLGVNLRRVIN